MNIMGLKALITGSQSYEEEFVKVMLDTIISSRKEEAEKQEKEFQLEKMRIEAGMATSNGNLADERQVHNNSRFEMSKAMPKFDAKEDFDGLKNLFITDQVKKRIPQEVRDHFVDVWGTIAKPQDLADKIDGYECVRKTNRKSVNLNPKVQQQGNVRSNTYSRDKGDHKVNLKSMRQEKVFPRSQYDRKNRPKFTCYSCGGEGHSKKCCPKLVKTNSDQDSIRKANVLRTVVDQEHVTKETAVVAQVMSHGRSFVDQGLCNLERIPVSVNGKQSTALIDSGTEICCVEFSWISDKVFFPQLKAGSFVWKGSFTLFVVGGDLRLFSPDGAPRS
ncbi:hypothetical protein AVEN_270351-1 [Araneus ventricosus]|uniref:CCHC-type domain-containing protein n=1 Tax=Araneus ventricosus TaxID=182803 RepID=A0A4Y2MRT7_ARAVE|nr:hypothetical protein AVEN_201789-1 [Araneus ventricosus]GBN28377.1 hypothetical protein AVEN_270351-1 [Araneus ventricosus]